VWLPPDLQVLNLGIICGAANVVTQHLLLVAPGAGLRYRLWMEQVGPNLTTQVPGQWQFDVSDNPTTIGFGRIARTGFNSGNNEWPGGAAIPANTALGGVSQSTLAALSLGITIGYTIEDI
jgi:hypothetical protein